MNRDTIVPHVVRVTLFMSICRVTPSRVCELKYIKSAHYFILFVTPSRVCELKCKECEIKPVLGVVTPSRVCELKFDMGNKVTLTTVVTPSRVCELKSRYAGFKLLAMASHPHGCVS